MLLPALWCHPEGTLGSFPPPALHISVEQSNEQQLLGRVKESSTAQDGQDLERTNNGGKEGKDGCKSEQHPEF